MKVQNIHTNAFSSSNNKRENFKKKDYLSGQTSFRGVGALSTGSNVVLSGLVKFWEAVERGGLAASFTIQDMLGTNIPRTWAAKDVGKDITGENNWGAVLENGLREFLTGPSMFLVPAGVLAASSKYGGKSHSVPVQTIKDFGEIISNSNIDVTNKEAFKKSFYESVLKKAFYNFDGINQADNLLDKGIDVNDYIKRILDMENAKSKGLFKNIRNIPVPDSKEDILDGIINMFVKNKKANTSGYPDFLNALISDSKYAKNSKNLEVRFSSLIERMGKYSDDFFAAFERSGKENVADFVEQFTKNRMGGRFATNIAMGVFTAAFMWFIPKIYTVNKTNPETDPVRQKAAELKSEYSDKSGDNVSFKGGGISKVMSDLGSKVDPSNFNNFSKAASSLECKGVDIARPMFYTLITGCTLVPRLIQSAKRDIESSKKNGGPVQWDETSNILRRDITTILTILFAMEGLGVAMALFGSKKSGVVLTSDILNKGDNIFKKFWNVINPESSVKVLGKAENTAQMSNFADMDQVMRFFEYNQEKKGNLYKLLHSGSKSNKEGSLYSVAKKLFGDVVDDTKVSVDDLRNKLNSGECDKKYIQEFLDILNDADKNPLLGFANKINAIFQTISLGIVTGFLGFGLPKINEIVIRNKYLKKDYALNPKYADPNVHIPDYSILKNLQPFEKQTYQYFLGNKR